MIELSSPPIFRTADGSPTLDWPHASGHLREKMHHSGGALSESLYIYHHAVHAAATRHWPLRVVSVGLGLGYNEWIAMAEVLLSGAPTWALWSFETQSILQESFTRSLESALEPNDEWAQLFLDVRNRVAESLNVKSEDLRQLARTALRDGRFELRGEFPSDRASVNGVTCIFYDAFSKKMNAELWEEPQLIESLRSCLAPQAVLATYAATGALNRALRSLGFRLHSRAGFLGKRESTLAIRE